MFLVDMSGRFHAVNIALANLVGKNVHELIGSNVSELVNRGILSQKMAGWTANPIQSKPVCFEEKFNEKWFEVTLYPVRNPRMMSFYMLCIFAISPEIKTWKSSLVRTRSISGLW